MDPFIGEIRMFGGNFAPLGWALCNGQLLAISQNDALFALIGTTYGGDGQQTFGLPDLQGRVPVHQGASFVIGQVAGVEQVTLLASQLPSHQHAAGAQTNAGTATDPTNALWASTTQLPYASPATNALVAMAPDEVAATGGNLPHDNMLPFLCVNFIIALEGIFPTQN